MLLKPFHIFSFLSLAFLAYSLSIYLKPRILYSPKAESNLMAVEGKLVWQRHNCQSCHQLYGLGGYLGPDLTNVYAAPGKGEALIRALVKTGSGQMPAFEMSEKETDQLVEFFRAMNATGNADPRNFEILSSGMTKMR